MDLWQHEQRHKNDICTCMQPDRGGGGVERAGWEEDGRVGHFMQIVRSRHSVAVAHVHAHRLAT